LQSVAGNHAVQRMLRQDAGEFPPPGGVGSPQPLPDDVARDARQSFGYDFSAVRTYSETAANDSAAELGAKAYTLGQHIVFGAGQYRPWQHAGRALLGHELAHVVQQSSLPGRAQSTASHFETEATSAAEDFVLQRPVAVTARGVPTIACSPEDPQEYVEEDERYRADRAEDIRRGRAKPKRGPGPGRGRPASTPGSVAKEAEREITQMLADAAAGRYRSSAIKTKRQLVARFRRLLRSYRMNEMVSIDRQLAAGTLSKSSRRALVNRKKGIVVDRNYLQGKFDEAVRTPGGENVSVQEKHVRGAPAQPYHETRPGKGSYAQPDFSITGTSEVGGRTRLHVNLKSHDLSAISPADARVIARAARDQAVKNAFGNPKRRGDVGHLPQGDEVIISFTDKPPQEIQAEMVKIMFEEGTPISQVRFGESTWHRPPGELEPPPTPLEALLGPSASGPLQEPVHTPAAGPVDPGAAAPMTHEPVPAEGEVRPAEAAPASGKIAKAGVPALSVGVQIAGGILHQRNQEARTEKARDKQETGYVPPTVVTGGVLDRMGDVLYDPDRSGARSVSLHSRMDMPKWRRWARSYFGGHKPGDTVKFTWYGEDDDEVIYTLQPDGRWSPDHKVEGALDINKVLDENVPDFILWSELDPFGGPA
jgi:Domain of unknown function (DUF4157)